MQFFLIIELDEQILHELLIRILIAFICLVFFTVSNILIICSYNTKV